MASRVALIVPFPGNYPLAAFTACCTRVIRKRPRTAIPYPIDTLFLFMANMGWNSAMNDGSETHRHAHAPGDERWRVT